MLTRRNEEEISTIEAAATEETEVMSSALDVIREDIMRVIAKSEDEVDQDLDQGQEIEETEEEEAEEADLEIGMRTLEDMIDIEVGDRHLLPDLLREIEAEEIEETGTETTTEEIGTDTMTAIEDAQELKDEMTQETEMTELTGTKMIGHILGQEVLTIGAKDQARRATIETILSDLEVLDPITSLKELKTEPRWKTMNPSLVKIPTMMPTPLGLEKVMTFTKMSKSQSSKKITTKIPWIRMPIYLPTRRCSIIRKVACVKLRKFAIGF